MSRTVTVEWAVRFGDGDIEGPCGSEVEARYEAQQARNTARYIPDPALAGRYATAEAVCRRVLTLATGWDVPPGG